MDRFAVTTSRSGEWMNDNKKRWRDEEEKQSELTAHPLDVNCEMCLMDLSKIIVMRVEAAAIWIEWPAWKLYVIEKAFNFQLSLMHMLLSLRAKTSNLLRNPQSYKYCCKVPIIIGLNEVNIDFVLEHIALIKPFRFQLNLSSNAAVQWKERVVMNLTFQFTSSSECSKCAHKCMLCHTHSLVWLLILFVFSFQCSFISFQTFTITMMGFSWINFLYWETLKCETSSWLFTFISSRRFMMNSSHSFN